MAALARSHRVHLTPPFYVALIAATWMIYLLDRTSDALSNRLVEPLSARHDFCRRHHTWLLAGLSPVLLLTGVSTLLWKLPMALVTQAIVIAIMASWYLAVHAGRDERGLQRSFVIVAMGGSLWLMNRLPLPLWAQGGIAVVIFVAATLAWERSPPRTRSASKEVVAGLLFTLGCAASIHLWANESHALLCTETGLVWALVTLNMLIIHGSEHQTGSFGEKTNSRTPWWLHVRGQRSIIVMLLVVAGVVAIWAKNPGARGVASATALSMLLMLALHLRVKVMEVQKFHFLADAAVVTPLPLVWILTKN